LPESALLNKSVISEHEEMFRWPIITREDEEAVLEVLRNGAMSGTDITAKFEREFAEWQNTEFALGFNNGTSSIQAAMFGCGVGVGNEVICPAITYWASCLSSYSLGATPIFAEIDPNTLCIDPNDIEHRITDHTKAIIVVHYVGYPCDMDPIMQIARTRGIKVIEDVSHAQGGLYKGRKLGSIGDVGAMSLMTAKAFAVGEAGMMVTDNREIYERAIAFSHYERYGDGIQTDSLKPYQGLPLGGYKYRMHQMSSAVGRVQLRHYDARMAEIQKAMNYFWDNLEGLPGIRAHRPHAASSSTMGGWYFPHGLYVPEELDGLSVTAFCKALQDQGCDMCCPGCNSALHLHPLFNTCDVYGHGKPTRIANTNRDVRQPEGSLPISEGIGKRTFAVPWFKHYRPEIIDEYISAFKNVIDNYKNLLAGDPGDPPMLGNWHFFKHSN